MARSLKGIAVRAFGMIAGLLVGIVASAGMARAEVRLPHTLSDHMVLQREAPIHVWGWADPLENLTVEFHAQSLAVQADKYGSWSAYLAPEHAGGPFTLSVKGSSTVTVSDVLVGDVWLASGQSNMELPLRGFPGSAVLKDADKEIASANLPRVRLLRLEHKTADTPGNDIAATWTECTPATATEFSAVAFLFGREISKHEDVPVGLIDSTWGGTPAEAWVSMQGLGADASLMPVFASWGQFAAEQSQVPAVLAEEKREDAAAKAAGQPLPKHPWHPMPLSWEPAGLYNGMIAPLTPYTIKGVIWYQGETNSKPDRAPLYARVFSALIGDWRTQWGQGSFPFLFVQISSFESPGEFWGTIRDAQRRTLAVANTGMAVSLDVGERNNVHPADKQTVAARLVLAARALAYGEKVEYSGPLFRSVTADGDGLRVWFDHADGLTTKGAAVDGFEIAGDDHAFVPAKASISRDTVVVSSASVPHPVYVRYAWQNATTANLYNKAGLPASTFTSE